MTWDRTEHVFFAGQVRPITIRDGVPMFDSAIIATRGFITSEETSEHVYIAGQSHQVRVRYLDINMAMLEGHLRGPIQLMTQDYINGWMRKAIEALAKVQSEDGTLTLKQAIEALDSIQRLGT